MKEAVAWVDVAIKTGFVDILCGVDFRTVL